MEEEGREETAPIKDVWTKQRSTSGRSRDRRLDEAEIDVWTNQRSTSGRSRDRRLDEAEIDVWTKQRFLDIVIMGLLILPSSFFLGLLVSTFAGSTAGSITKGFGFVRDSSFDGRQVTNDADRLQLVTPSLSRCAVTCAMYDWCSSFFYTRATGACSLHATAFVGPSFATLSAGTHYFKQTEDWCPNSPMVLFNRLARMCVYFEVDTAKMAGSAAEADNACVTKGMRLIHNLNPSRMNALLNFTTKNKDTISQSTFIGLKRNTAGHFEWVDGQPLDTAAMAPFWEAGQPNGQDCVIVRASVDSTLNDVTCGPHVFICEKNRPQ
ncbi:hypothetical protein ACOMHN_053764 [Nucella lapillus]